MEKPESADLHGFAIAFGSVVDELATKHNVSGPDRAMTLMGIALAEMLTSAKLTEDQVLAAIQFALPHVASQARGEGTDPGVVAAMRARIRPVR